jgi:hypothetical protein
MGCGPQEVFDDLLDDSWHGLFLPLLDLDRGSFSHLPAVSALARAVADGASGYAHNAQRKKPRWWEQYRAIYGILMLALGRVRSAKLGGLTRHAALPPGARVM